MGKDSLARRIGQSTAKARELLAAHKKTFKTFWGWNEGTVNYAMLEEILWTVFGWCVHVESATNPRMLQNFLMQANGAEMLRLACIIATEAGIKVCATIHDAILIEAPATEIEQTVAETQRIMAEASAIVLDGFELRTDADIIRYPERYQDKRGEEMWHKVMGIINSLKK